MQPALRGKSPAARLAAALACAVLAAAPAACLAITDHERIEAVSEFLIDRAKANYLYIFEQRIKNNRTVRCYFPTVYSYIRDYDLRIFLKTRELWSKSIESDLERLLRGAAARAVASVDLRRTAMAATDRYVEISQYLTIDYKGRSLPLSYIPLNTTQEERDLINGFYGINSLRDFLLRVDNTTRADEECGISNVTRDEVNAFAREAKAVLSDLAAWKRHLDSHAPNLRFDAARLAADCAQKDPKLKLCAARERLQAAADGVKAALDEVKAAGDEMRAIILANAGLPDKLLKYEKDLKDAKTKTEKVLIAIRLLREVAPNQNDEIVESLKKHVLFFAEISDAESTDQVKAVLMEYTLPAVSFGLKREKYKGHAMVSAYLAYAYGKVADSDGGLGRDNNKGIYAPIGLDLSLGMSWGGSFSLMVAPVDFGYPVSLKLNGVKEDLKFSDVVAPSVALSYGVAKYPVTVGVAYQRGRKDPVSSEVETRLLLFLGFDMPLFPLF